MPPWSISDTKELVASLHGQDRLASIAPSLYAMSQRQCYARFHYQEVERLLTDFRNAYLKQDILLSVIHGTDEDARAAFERFMMKAGANVIACVLSIHSMADVIAFAVYLALGYQSVPKLRKEKAVSAATLLPQLAVDPNHKVIYDALAQFTSTPSFKHVEALSNHSKHRGLIKPLLNEDWTGVRERPYELRFASFIYDGFPFPEAEITSVIGPAYQAASTAVVVVGSEMNLLLSRSVG